MPRPNGASSRELGAEVERQWLVTSDDRVDARDGIEVGFVEYAFCVAREGVGEGVDFFGLDRQPGGGAMAAPAAEQVRARPERAVQVERRDGAS